MTAGTIRKLSRIFVAPHALQLAACLGAAACCGVAGCGNGSPTSATTPTLAVTATPTPTSLPVATATLAPNQCRRLGDCTFASFLCLQPGGFAGCGICYGDAEIDAMFERCTTDADCVNLGADSICEQLGPASHTCSPCTGSVFVCMGGCSADAMCATGQECEAHRCVGLRCASDADCPAQFTCAASGGNEPMQRCTRRACTADGDCAAGGFCVLGACYDTLGECVPLPA